MRNSLASAGRSSAPTASSTRWRSPAASIRWDPNSLDALCRRYGIDNSHRTKHGALLNSELLAEVYIELIGGKQTTLVLESVPEQRRAGDESRIAIVVIGERPRPLLPRLSEAELIAHAALVAELGEAAIWRRFG